MTIAQAITRTGRETALALTLAGLITSPVKATSHMDAPLITLDPAANTTDVYAFLTERNGQKYLHVALGVYPHEEPGIGPNKYNFDDNVLYQIILSQGGDLATGDDSVAYQFRFSTAYKNNATILQSYLGVVEEVDDANQNLTQTYTVTRVAGGVPTMLGTGVVPPNNQGIATPLYNQDNDGFKPAKDGVATEADLDPYTAQSIATLSNGYRAFAGQREDGFYADVQAVFDLLQLRSGTNNSFDSQGGYNMHTIALEIPVSDIGGEDQVVGVYATTSRRQMAVLDSGSGLTVSGNFVQVGRQGNPLFCEALVGIADKDLYNRTKPNQDAALFEDYAETPELAALINAIIFNGEIVAPETDRSDLVGIFIPDVIKVDLSTGPARLTGGNADDEGFSRLSVFGGDALTSTVQAGLPGFPAGTIAGGWPNGRRYGDDVIDIAISAILSDLRTDPLTIVAADGIDNVSANDAVYHKVFPYAGTPHNGRNYGHNDQLVTPPLVNISTRGNVGTGNNVLIGGFIVRGDRPVTILVRAVGPSLEGFGLDDFLPNPTLEVYRGSTLIAQNDDWRSDQETEIMDTGFAPGNDNESAVTLTLGPGAYTAIVRDATGGTGIGLVDAFWIDTL